MAIVESHSCEISLRGVTILIYFDLTKFKKPVEESTNDIEIWLTLLKESQDLQDVPPSLAEKKEFKAFFEGLRHANFSEEQALNYNKDMTDEMCWKAALDFREAKGEAKGKAEGLAEGEAKGKAEGKAEAKAEMARILKQQGVALETISIASGLSIDEIAKL